MQATRRVAQAGNREGRGSCLPSHGCKRTAEHGASPSVVQRQMRHSDSRITLQKYSHVIGDAQRRAVDSLAGRVLGISFGANSVNWSQPINKRVNINNLAEACGSRIHHLSESKEVTRNRNPSKTTQRNAWERLLPTDCPRVSFMRFSSLAAPSEPPCYSLSATLLEPPECRCSRLSEYQRDGVAPAAPSHQPSRREASSSSCDETCASRFDQARL